MYTITLSDGTKLEGLTFERNIFFSDKAIDASIFRGKLSPVTITNDNAKPDEFDGISGTHSHMEVCYVKEMDGKFALALNDINNDRWEKERNRADLEYIAMMTGIQL